MVRRQPVKSRVLEDSVYNLEFQPQHASHKTRYLMFRVCYGALNRAEVVKSSVVCLECLGSSNKRVCCSIKAGS